MGSMQVAATLIVRRVAHPAAGCLQVGIDSGVLLSVNWLPHPAPPGHAPLHMCGAAGAQAQPACSPSRSRRPRRPPARHFTSCKSAECPARAAARGKALAPGHEPRTAPPRRQAGLPGPGPGPSEDRKTTGGRSAAGQPGDVTGDVRRFTSATARQVTTGPRRAYVCLGQ